MLRASEERKSREMLNKSPLNVYTSTIVKPHSDFKSIPMVLPNISKNATSEQTPRPEDAYISPKVKDLREREKDKWA
jgi:hypothetical protein